MEFNCRTSSWCCRMAWCRGNYTDLVTRSARLFRGFCAVQMKTREFSPYRTISQIRKPKKKKTQVLQSTVPVHAAGDYRPATLFRYNIIVQKSQNHGKRSKEGHEGLLSDSKDPLSSCEEARPACDDNTATKPSLNSSKLTCEFEKSGQHCFQQATYITHWPLGFSQMKDSYIAFNTEDSYFFQYLLKVLKTWRYSEASKSES